MARLLAAPCPAGGRFLLVVVEDNAIILASALNLCTYYTICNAIKRRTKQPKHEGLSSCTAFDKVVVMVSSKTRGERDRPSPVIRVSRDASRMMGNPRTRPPPHDHIKGGKVFTKGLF